jgi:hypothetical protein
MDDNTKDNNILRLLKKVKFNYGIGVSNISHGNSTVQIDHNGIIRRVDLKKDNSYFLTAEMTMLYQLWPKVEFGWYYSESFGGTVLEYNGLIVQYNWGWLWKNKVLKMSPYVSLGYGSLGKILSKYDNQEDFKWGGKQLSANEIQVALITKGFMPLSGVNFSLNLKRVNIFVDVKGWFPVNSNLGVSMKETQGFFLLRKEAFENKNFELVSISNNPDFEINYAVSFGIGFGL